VKGSNMIPIVSPGLIGMSIDYQVNNDHWLLRFSPSLE
jgi:hypothetical protein